MSDDVRYRINSPAVISEFLEGEVVVIHLDTGSYYSLRGAGAEVWTALEGGASLAELHRQLPRLYQGDPAALAARVSSLRAQLVTEGLLVEEERPAPDLEALLPRDPTGPRPFEHGALESFEDMKELLVLDPIHDVDEAGWPRARTEDES